MGPSSDCAASATLPLLPATDDELARTLALVARTALRLAPRRRRRTSAGRLALATTERVVDGVYRDTTDLRTLPLPAVTSGLADLDELVLGVPHLADRGLAADM